MARRGAAGGAMNGGAGGSGSAGRGVDRTGVLHLMVETAGKKISWAKRFAVVERGRLVLRVGTSPDGESKADYDLDGCDVQPVDVSRTRRKLCFQVSIKGEQAGSGPIFAVDTSDEQDAWMSVILTAGVPTGWPGGADDAGRPVPLLYSRISEEDRKAGRSPLVSLPTLRASPAYRRRALLLRKLRLCAVVFDGPNPMSGSEARDLKRVALLELVDFVDMARTAFQDARVLEDTITMIRLNLFRSLPPPQAGKSAAAGDGDDEEEPFMDPQWPHLAITYELLLHLVSTDNIDLAAKKRVIDASFVKQLLLLFDSQDMREREYLKTITHRIYSKLTQRRALIRRVICYIFYEFVYESDLHNGIAEMLEILASIINGFAVPIKMEHKTMLSRALLPLHKSSIVMQYHPQLSYCMALYVAKDHTLTRQIVPGLLKYWPYRNYSKQIIFLNELEDVFEYVQPDDCEVIRGPLVTCLVNTIGGDHFQVAERALCLWNSDRFLALMVEDPTQRQAVLPTLFPVLYATSVSHWHESVRALSHHVLSQYMDIDPDLFAACASEYEAATGRTVGMDMPEM